MSGVMRAELLRVRSRRFTWLVLAVVALVCSGLAVSAWQDSKHPTAAERQWAQQAYADAVSHWEGGGRDHCLARAAELAQQGVPPFDCDAAAPTPDLYGLDVTTSFANDATRSTLGSIALPVAIGALLLGASLVTAEFGAGSMSLWLTVVAPRARVYRTKLTAAAVAGACVALVGVVVGVGGAFGAYAWHGHVGGAVGRSVGVAASTAGAVLALGVLAGLAGAALGFALRHVAVVIGVVTWWVLAVEVVAPLAWQRAAPVGLVRNARAWVEGAATYPLRVCTPSGPGSPLTDCSNVDQVIGWGTGGYVVLVATVALVLVGLVAFRSRDVV